MLRSTLLLTILGAFFITACGPAITPQPTKTNLPALGGNWTIKLAQSGGIMGLSRSLEIRSDGTYTVINNRTAAKKDGQLSKDQVAVITKQASAINYSPITGPEQYACADCFVYDLEITGTSRFSVQLNDVSLPNSGMEPLITSLRDIMDKELK